MVYIAIDIHDCELFQKRVVPFCKQCFLRKSAMLILRCIRLFDYGRLWFWPSSLELRIVCCKSNVSYPPPPNRTKWEFVDAEAPNLHLQA